MSSDAEGGPGSLDPNAPSTARAYDYFLGGAHNFQADRDFAEQVILLAPWMPAPARLNRSFVHRVVEFYLEQGITQILDLGSGIPTALSVHRTAQEHYEHARVVYVDYDPVVFTHVASLISDTPNVTVLHCDIRDPGSVLNHPKTTALLDFRKPIGVLLIGVMNFVGPEHEPDRMLATYRDQLAPGSFLAISHLTSDRAEPQQARTLAQVMAAYKATQDELRSRSREEILPWFGDFELVEPGMVSLPHWRPADSHESESEAGELSWCAVGRKAG